MYDWLAGTQMRNWRVFHIDRWGLGDVSLT